MSYTNPTIEDFKLYFVRDFDYGATEDLVMDTDLSKALVEAGAFINDELFSSQSIYTVGFMYLMAHYLVTALQNSTQGASGRAKWLQQSHGVGPINESFAIPQSILESPYLSLISKTNYGQYYISLIYPMIAGNIVSVEGATRA